MGEAAKNTLDDSTDVKSRLWKLTCVVLGWLALVIPIAVATDKVTGLEALAFLRWLLPAMVGIFGAIKAGQKTAGVLLTGKSVSVSVGPKNASLK